MKNTHDLNEYATAEHALRYLSRADSMPHRTEGEAALIEFIPQKVQRILDLGSGDGRLLALLKIGRQDTEGIALDFSPTMITAARERFRNDQRVQVVDHNLDNPLPDLGQFDVIVSSFAIHHCADERKRLLYSEIFNALSPGGIFCNLEHVASPTTDLHNRFIHSLGIDEGEEDSSNILLDVETQTQWLREIGFQKRGLPLEVARASSIWREQNKIIVSWLYNSLKPTADGGLFHHKDINYEYSAFKRSRSFSSNRSVGKGA